MKFLCYSDANDFRNPTVAKPYPEISNYVSL